MPKETSFNAISLLIVFKSY